MFKKLRPFLALLFWLASSGLFAQTDSTDKFVFLEAGFPSTNEYLEVQSRVAEKWNIHHKWVAGCIVSNELADSMRIFNNNTSARLVQKYGEDWNVRYYQEIEEAYKKYMVVVNQLRIDTITRENHYFTERVMNNPDFNLLWIDVVPKEERIEESEAITVNNLQDDSQGIMYRGFRNLFEISLANSKESSFRLECINCSIKANYDDDSLPAQQYVIRPGRHKESVIHIYSKNDLISTFSFTVRNLPDPEIYFNGVRNGNSVDLASLNTIANLHASYPEEVTLRSQFIVTKWEMHAGKDLTLYGRSNTIDEDNLESLKSISPGEQISFICTVKGSDGILRKKAAAFVLK